MIVIILMEDFTFIHVCSDSFQIVLEHHRPFAQYISKPNCTRA